MTAASECAVEHISKSLKTNPPACAQKYVVCNADVGDSGSCAGRVFMEGDPVVLIEGLIFAGLALGALEQAPQHNPHLQEVPREKQQPLVR